MVLAPDLPERVDKAGAHPACPGSGNSGWDFRGCDTQYGVHGVHTYVAAMIPQLAARLIDEWVPSNGTVLDPFCGGGAVLAEAVSTGREAVGRDVNDLAVLISMAKTTHISKQEAMATLQQVLRRIRNTGQPPLMDSILAYWFKAEHFAPLHSIRQAIEHTIPAADPKLPLFLTSFSATVRDVSLTYRNEIRLRRMSPAEVENFRPDPIARFKTRAEKAIAAVSQLPNGARASVAVGNAKSLDLPDKSVSAIVCSPPYGDERNGVSYAQFSRNMLAWLGRSTDAIRESKGLTLGWGNALRQRPASRTLDAALNNITEFPTSVAEAVSFYADYQATLAEMARVTHGPIIIVIGPRVLRDTVFDNGAITVDLMENVGVTLAARFRRMLPSKRLPRMRKFGAAINQEDILVFEQ